MPATVTRRGPWSKHEDIYLLRLVDSHGPLNWVRISETLVSRSPKQCRERYHQNLKPSLTHDPITPAEGVEIERLVLQIGKRWAEIARRLNGRSDNSVKNWWNGNQSRRRRLENRQAGPTPGGSGGVSRHMRKHSRRQSGHLGHSEPLGHLGHSALPPSPAYDGRVSDIPRLHQEPSPWPGLLPSPLSFRSESVESGFGFGEMPVPKGHSVGLPPFRPRPMFPEGPEGRMLPSMGELSERYLDAQMLASMVTAPSSPVQRPVRDTYRPLQPNQLPLSTPPLPPLPPLSSSQRPLLPLSCSQRPLPPLPPLQRPQHDQARKSEPFKRDSRMLLSSLLA